jgi:hypothetical protein
MAQGERRERMFPIEQIQHGFIRKYTYKNQLIDSPLALQIPLLESRDPEVSLEFYRFKSKRKLMRWISSIGLGLSIYSFLKPGTVSDEMYFTTVGAATLVNFYVGTLSMRHLNKALNRYNSLAYAGPQLSLQFTPNDRVGSSMALQWKYNF